MKHRLVNEIQMHEHERTNSPHLRLARLCLVRVSISPVWALVSIRIFVEYKQHPDVAELRELLEMRSLHLRAVEADAPVCRGDEQRLVGMRVRVRVIW